jgi:hypothetical protein
MTHKDFTLDHDFAHSAGRSLLDRGEIHPQWLAAFLPQINDPANFSAQDTWPAGYIRLMHFASMYLPLRYASWTRREGRRNQHTEEILATVQLHIEETLWSRALEARMDSGSNAEAKVVALVLGERNPIGADDVKVDAWKDEFRTNLRAVGARWRLCSQWPRWPSIAVRFASFYLDLVLRREFEIPKIEAFSAGQRELLKALALRMPTRVVEAIAMWLAAVAALRDNSGTPKIGQSRSGGKSVGIGTTCEALMLGRLGEE